MRAEDVNPDWVEIVGRVFANAQDCDGEDGFRACVRDLCPCRKYAQTALAAVAPLIAAQERERCARVADREADTQRIVRGRQTEDWEYLQKQDAKTEVAENIAAAIRALGDADG